MYFLRTGGYLKRYKNYFPTRAAAITMLKEILRESGEENDSGTHQLKYTSENLEASISLLEIEGEACEELENVFKKSPLRGIPKFCKSAELTQILLDAPAD